MKKIFHVVGAGRVGLTFAKILSAHADWRISHIVSRKPHQDAFGAVILADIAALPRADVVIIAVPDNAIGEVAAKLACSDALDKQTLVLHVSGAKNIEVLRPVAEQGALTGSLHPVFAFADVEQSAARLRGHLCALEAASAEAVDVLQQLATALGLTAFMMPSEYKARYHAALSVASNFSTALAAYAQNLLLPIGLPEGLPRRLVTDLMRNTVDYMDVMSPVQALTGPIVRGDDTTVAAHLAALTPAEQRDYRAWAVVVLDLATERLDSQSREKVQTALGCKTK